MDGNWRLPECKPCNIVFAVINNNISIETIRIVCEYLDEHPYYEKPEKPSFVFLKHYMHNEKECSFCHN
ncbi:MAG: hypothetical protein AB1782_10980 [Cyanobacteriota bacterium]